MQMQGSFNANQFEPNQGFGIHPPAQKIPFTITGTEIKENSAKDGGYFQVEFTTPLGLISFRYNIWSKTPKAVEIAHGQLSALCRATSRYQIDWANEGAALRGGQGLADIGYQKGEEPDPAFPDRKGYTEIKRVYDVAGNDPAKPGVAQAQPQGQQGGFQQPQQNQPQQNQPQGGPAPLQQQPGGGWGQQPTQQQQPAQQQPQGQQQAPQGQTGGAWQPGGGATGGPATTPPWGQR